MKTLFTFLFLTVYSLTCVAGPVIADVAVEGYPGANNIINGRYKYYKTSTTGHLLFQSDRTDGVFLKPLIISWNSLAARWEISVTKIVSGASTRVTVATSSFTGTYPPGKGWSVLYPYGNPLGLYTPMSVYETIEQTSTCDRCRWSSPTTWSSGILPRAYDNVTINSDVQLDMEAICHTLKVNSVATFPYDGHSLTGSTSVARLKLNGNLDVGVSGRIEIYSLEMAGNARQTLQSNSERGVWIRMQRAIINNPYGVSLLSPFGFFSIPSAAACETQFVKGKIVLDNYILSCQTILGAAVDRYVVTNGTGYLVLPANNVGSTYNRYFPIGSSENSYTPLRISNTTTSWSVQLMARAEYNASLFSATPHVNVLYQTRSLSVVRGPDTPRWLHQAYWYAADESAGFNHSARVRVDRRTETAWAMTGSEGIPTATVPYSYVYNASTWESFGIFQATTGSSRLSAEEKVSNLGGNQDQGEYGTYPNPATAAGFKIRVDDADAAKIKLISISGSSIRFKTEKESPNTISLQPLDIMPAGIYILQVQDKNLIRTHKVIIK
ncbi:MAG: T9SS type A sorting domain-containing protein [Dyadobacter sp.]|uniref:T9SS type A sorting domain-containing protein n=1 Tax=Dyadobacter sp. TaxID=1914288 RepID=UPI00326549CC